jgi:hypothetical protein
MAVREIQSSSRNKFANETDNCTERDKRLVQEDTDRAMGGGGPICAGTAHGHTDIYKIISI